MWRKLLNILILARRFNMTLETKKDIERPAAGKAAQKHHESSIPKSSPRVQYKTLHELEQECRNHMKNNGVIFNGTFNKDGQIHRFSKEGADQKDRDEFYSFSTWEYNSLPYVRCYYGTWSGGLTEFTYENWSDSHSDFSPEDLKKFKEDLEKRNKEYQKLKEKGIEERLKRAKLLWEKASEKPTVPEHTSYLERKKVKAHGIRYGFDDYKNPVLVIPVTNFEGDLQGVELIKADSEKRIHGLKKGNFHLIGEIKSNSLIYVVEGYSTGASPYEACGKPVFIAFDCGNLDSVIGRIREKYPKHQIIILADDDVEVDGNPGKTKAEEAAKRHKCTVVLPKFPPDFKLPDGKRPTDFNDLLVSFGPDELKKQIIKKHLSPIDISAFLNMEIPPRELILDPWLPEQGITMLHAKRGIGKTFVALEVAYAIATGGGVFGKWNAPKPRKVLYIDGEMPAATMQERLAKIVAASEKQPPSSEYFKLITPDLQESGIRDLATIEGQRDIDAYIEDFDVLILDNLSTLVRNGAENEAESWIPVQEWLLQLRKVGKSVIMIHHSGKSGNQRGTSKREDILDTVITLKHPKDPDPSEGAKFEIHFEKSRGFTDEKARPFCVQLFSNDQDPMKWNVSEIEDVDLDKIIELNNDGLTQREIAKEIGKSAAYVNKLIRKAKEAGFIL